MRLDVVVWCALAGVVGVIIAAVAQRAAIVRLGVRSERALNDLRERLIGHIHRISLADHNDERRGALVGRVTSDIETLSDFFRWGGLAFLIDGTLMVIVAAVMIAYNWLLAVIAIGIAISIPWRDLRGKTAIALSTLAAGFVAAAMIIWKHAVGQDLPDLLYGALRLDFLPDRDFILYAIPLSVGAAVTVAAILSKGGSGARFTSGQCHSCDKPPRWKSFTQVSRWSTSLRR